MGKQNQLFEIGEGVETLQEHFTLMAQAGSAIRGVVAARQEFDLAHWKERSEYSYFEEINGFELDIALDALGRYITEETNKHATYFGLLVTE